MPRGVYCHKKTGPKAKRVALKCEVCEGDITLTCAKLRARGRVRFCSVRCSGIARRKPSSKTNVMCSHCGSIFTKRTSFLAERNYCSMKCVTDHARKTDAKWKNKQQIKEYMADYVQNNLEKHRERSQAWVRNNSEKRKEVQRRYRQKHKEFIAAATRARRAGAKAGDFTFRQWLAMKNRYEYKCLCCGRSEPEIALEPDHIKAISNGGPHTEDNIQPLCRSCNSSKGAKTVDYRPKH